MVQVIIHIYEVLTKEAEFAIRGFAPNTRRWSRVDGSRNSSRLFPIEKRLQQDLTESAEVSEALQFEV